MPYQIETGYELFQLNSSLFNLILKETLQCWEASLEHSEESSSWFYVITLIMNTKVFWCVATAVAKYSNTTIQARSCLLAAYICCEQFHSFV